jgi:hypothetical protein
MMVMPANNSSPVVHYWAGKYPSKIGWLCGPSSIGKTKLRNWIPFALDNDAFSAWDKGVEWSERAYFSMLDHVAKLRANPIWALVPDVVADKQATIKKWHDYAPRVRKYGWPLAFAAQDGMTPADVPVDADVVFIGGTTDWKWKTFPAFTDAFPRVHIGRVNSIDKLWLCEDFGVESVDGTGWFRDGVDNIRFLRLEEFLKGERKQTILELITNE